jgi:hypothetical protein
MDRTGEHCWGEGMWWKAARRTSYTLFDNGRRMSPINCSNVRIGNFSPSSVTERAKRSSGRPGAKCARISAMLTWLHYLTVSPKRTRCFVMTLSAISIRCGQASPSSHRRVTPRCDEAIVLPAISENDAHRAVGTLCCRAMPCSTAPVQRQGGLCGV